MTQILCYFPLAYSNYIKKKKGIEEFCFVLHGRYTRWFFQNDRIWSIL